MGEVTHGLVVRLMNGRRVTVLGGGNTAFSVAARLTLDGHSVTLYELPSFAESIESIRRKRAIHLAGACGEGTAVLNCVTTDAEEALRGADLILPVVPAYAQRPFLETCSPHLERGQTVVLMPGNLGSLEWARGIREMGRENWVTLAEVDTAPYVCRKTEPDEATIWGAVTGLGLGVLPSRRTAEVLRMLEPLFPGMRPYDSVLACGLSAMNPVVHPAGVLMNAGRIEYSRGEFYFYEEGVTPAVVKVIEAVDGERLLLGRALGHQLSPVHEAFHAAGFGPRGDLWSTINGSWMLTRLKAPGSLQNRWLTEDLPYGLVSWSSLGEMLEVETPAMGSLIDLGSIVMGFDARERGRTVEQLGISGVEPAALAQFLREGTWSG